MKKIFILMLLFVFVISMTITGISCKATEAVEDAMEEVEEAVEDAMEEVEEAVEAVEEKEPVTLVFWTHEDENLKNTNKDLIAEYEAMNPNVTIEYQTFPFSDYETALVTAIASGEGPDLYDIGDWNIPVYYEKGMVAPIDHAAVGYDTQADLEADWLPSSLEGFRIGGNIYGVPMEFNTFSLYINPDHFKEAGLDPEKDYPKTWDELADVANQLKIIEDGIWKREGFDFPYLGPVWTTLLAEPFFNQMGASMINAEGTESTINSPEAVAAFTKYVELITVHETGSPNVGASTSLEPNLDYAAGDLSMWISGPWAAPSFTGHPLEDTYMVVPLPQMSADEKVQDATVLYAWSWVVNPKSDKTTAAWEFIDFLSSNQETFLENNGYIQPRLGWLESETAMNFNYLDVFIDDMKIGKYMVRTTKFGEVSSALNSAMERCLLEGMDVQASLDLAKEEIDAALSS